MRRVPHTLPLPPPPPPPLLLATASYCCSCAGMLCCPLACPFLMYPCPSISSSVCLDYQAFPSPPQHGTARHSTLAASHTCPPSPLLIAHRSLSCPLPPPRSAALQDGNYVEYKGDEEEDAWADGLASEHPPARRRCSAGLPVLSAGAGTCCWGCFLCQCQATTVIRQSCCLRLGHNLLLQTLRWMRSGWPA